MWERKELKDNAKYVLRTTYWKAFLVSLILGFVGGGAGIPNVNFNYRSSDSSFDSQAGWIDWGLLAPILALAAGFIIVVIFLALGFRIFLGFPLEVGSMKFFKRAAEQDANLNHLGYAFNGQRYMDVVGAMLWRGFLNFLWYLLLIIPGIVKSYAYSMVPFILANNPNIGYKRAVELSNQMTRGHKFRIFVLDLSFLGWIFLGLLACGVGVLFVMPYINATKAELYLALRKEALERNLTTGEELRLVPPPLF
ncbi:DUF975 family protein [Paenibacillus sp. 1011MAR3C5]|uniref:DUF975 family protein n=1 Tax=Paenibacillus sp. 1011MAR3C5 TaxID=1675787 RepID=UPI000E6CF420|nr:DUF975 family protein [Paenibacillus sp. 1011MAR3C5]RJE88418.1 DUF975 family protein [Paenibacillus sp. 1011MAR3C5]